MRAVFLMAYLLLGTVIVADSQEKAKAMNSASVKETITLGAGCFWCIEAVFEELEGVEAVVSGYSGGPDPNPSYRDVCDGDTGHAEVVQVRFDPKAISVREILQIFFTVHDPTTLNRQGADVGTQYRSVIFFHTPEQRTVAEKVIKEITEAEVWSNPIVTELVAFERFFEAEEYHQQYYELNQNQPYCRAVIAPKVAKLREKFQEKLKQKE